MIGLVLVTHGRLAVEFRAALEHVVGPQRQIEAVTIGPDDDVEQRRKDIIEAVKRVDTGQGVAILTDMFGGTPSNLAISCMGRPNVEVLAGINMPMLVKLAKDSRGMPARRGGRGGAGGRAQIRHHRQPRACREMSDATGGDRELGHSPSQEPVVRVLEIVNKKGLHARASAKFVQTVERFDATVQVRRGNETVGGTSIMGLMMLGAATGTSITVEATGNEAAAVVDALAKLVTCGFGEED